MPRDFGASDGLKFGETLWSIDEAVSLGERRGEAFAQSSAAIWRWYQTHSSTRIAELLLELCSVEFMAAHSS